MAIQSIQTTAGDFSASLSAPVPTTSSAPSPGDIFLFPVHGPCSTHRFPCYVVTRPIPGPTPVPDFPTALEEPHPLDPRYFFMGAPSADADSAAAGLINEVRERAQRWKSRTVNFSLVNVLATQRKESVTLPDGTWYSLTTLVVE